jgi:hypothetical protein
MQNRCIDSDIEAQILAEYRPGLTSLRGLARKYSTTHTTVKNILIRNNRKFLSIRENKYYNISVSLRFDVSFEYLMKYKDIDKLSMLNKLITNRDNRFNFDTETYLKYLEKFYHCERFEKIYRLWLVNDKEPMRKPSIDHIIPKSKGGKENCIDNMQIITWFANRAKGNCLPDQWQSIIDNIHEYLI